jgi:hypothetical protein
MTPHDQDVATGRLRRALSAFQIAQNHLLGAERRLKGLPRAEVDAFWNGLGRRLEANMRATATEAVAAFQQFSAAGLVAGAADRHLLTHQRLLAAAELELARHAAREELARHADDPLGHADALALLGADRALPCSQGRRSA